MDPNNHNVKESELKNLRPGELLVRPPRYSPELMQAVEHSHSVTQNTYLKARLLANMAVWDIQAEWKLLQDAFWKAITPSYVAKTAARVPEAARQIVKALGGRIDKEYT